MDFLLVLSAMLAGTAVGMLYDPTTWLLLAVAAAAAFANPPWLPFGIAVLLGIAIRWFLAFNNGIGAAAPIGHYLLAGVAVSLLMGIAFGLALAARKILR